MSPEDHHPTEPTTLLSPEDALDQMILLDASAWRPKDEKS